MRVSVCKYVCVSAQVCACVSVHVSVCVRECECTRTGLCAQQCGLSPLAFRFRAVVSPYAHSRTGPLLAREWPVCGQSTSPRSRPSLGWTCELLLVFSSMNEEAMAVLSVSHEACHVATGRAPGVVRDPGDRVLVRLPGGRTQGRAQSRKGPQGQPRCLQLTFFLLVVFPFLKFHVDSWPRFCLFNDCGFYSNEILSDREEKKRHAFLTIFQFS